VEEVVVGATWLVGSDGGAVTVTACMAVADPAPMPIAAANLIKLALDINFILLNRYVQYPRPG
jgi:hypothetical protein